MDYLHVVIHREKKGKLKKKLNGPALDGLLVKVSNSLLLLVHRILTTPN